MTVRRAVVVALLLLGAAANARAQPPDPVAELAAAATPIAGDELRRLDAAELGATLTEGQAAQLAAAHALLESYFAISGSKDRAAISTQIAALSLPVTTVGRLTRIRLGWPAVAGGSIFHVRHQHGPFTAEYLVATPKGYQRDASWPMIVELPSQSATSRPRDAAKNYRQTLADEARLLPSAIILLPLPDPREEFGPGASGMSAAMEPIRDVADLLNVDPARVTMLGAGDAAFAVWNLALHEPTYFAGFAPLAGAADYDWQRLRLVNLHNLQAVVWQDDNDPLVKPASAKTIVRAMKNLKLDVKFIETTKLGHEPNAEIAMELRQSLLDCRRNLYPPSISLQSNRPETRFNRIDWLQVWEPVDIGEQRRVYLRRGPGFMLLDEKTWRVDATIDGQQINVTTDNVDSFRLLLNKQMLDLARPVRVVVNRKTRFEKIVEPNFEQMLKDQLRLGRGWRYYPAAIDIDLLPPATQPATCPTTGPTTRTGRIIVGPQKE